MSGGKVTGRVVATAGAIGAYQGILLGVASTVSLIALPVLALTGGLSIIGFASYKIYKSLRKFNATKNIP
jgi:hypothetical protein